MSVHELKICNESEFKNLSNDANIVIQVSMLVDGVTFKDAMVVDSYKDRPVNDVMDEMNDKGKVLIRRYASAIAGRDKRADY